MIRGRFVAQIEINISVSENTPGLLEFEKLQKAVKEKQCAAIQTILQDEFGEIGTVSVTQMYADVWRVIE